jgi:hypothetical protein
MRSTWLVGVVIAGFALGCSKEESKGAAPSASASAAAAPTPSASVAAAPSASAAPEPHHDCPAGSTGTGSFGHPCEAKGPSRMMSVAWNGKADASGAPSFKVQNTSKLPILYGKMGVYFYDKAGKQIDVKEAVEGSEKTHAFHTCSGNIFAGELNPGEKATINFSCVKKKDVPEGATGIEAEMQEVGFADASGKKNDFYWKNTDLTPEERPKGGVKK